MRYAWLLWCAAALGAEQAVPPGEWYTNPILQAQERQSAMYAYVSRNIPPLPRFQTLEAWQSYKPKLRSRLLRLLGIDDILAQNQLRVVRQGRIDRDTYTIEKIRYESYPGMWVSALVWSPKRVTGKAPAAVSISGHTYCESKAADYVQQRNYNLVRRGFIVVSYDYFGCGDRGIPAACQPGGWGGFDHLNSLFSYTRRTPTGIEALDGIRAVDYLYSRPDVDRTRILFTGESGGGNNTYWVSALDERVTLSVPVSSGGAFSQWIKADLNYDWHQRPPGLRAVADIGSLYALIAPRPLLIVNGHPELAEFALPDALRSMEYAKAIYRLYGKQDAIAFRESTTGHGYQPDKRAQLYQWVERWFFDGKMPHGTSELPYTPEPRESLRVELPAGNLSIAALAARWVRESANEPPMPASPKEWQQAARPTLEALVARRDPNAVPGVIYRYDYQLEANGYEAERLQFEVAEDLLIPGILVRKRGQSKYKTVILVEKNRGRSGTAHQLLERGYALLLLDPRGTGEMEWGAGRTSNWANFMGRPPVGMWSEDISKVAAYLSARPDVLSVGVLAFGIFGKAALYTMALDPHVAAAAVATDSASYRQEATSGLVHIYADVPRILAWGDLAQVAALAAPRPLLVFAAGRPESLNREAPRYFAPLPRFQIGSARTAEAELSESYGWTRRFYGSLHAAGQFQTGGGEPSVPDWFAAHF